MAKRALKKKETANKKTKQFLIFFCFIANIVFFYRVFLSKLEITKKLLFFYSFLSIKTILITIFIYKQKMIKKDLSYNRTEFFLDFNYVSLSVLFGSLFTNYSPILFSLVPVYFLIKIFLFIKKITRMTKKENKVCLK